jgi:hypothetical protein
MAQGHSIPAAPATSSAVATAVATTVVAALPWGLALKLVVLAVLAIFAVVGEVATAITNHNKKYSIILKPVAQVLN